MGEMMGKNQNKLLFTYSIPSFLERACKGKIQLNTALSSCNSQIPKYLSAVTPTAEQQLLIDFN